MALWNKEFDLDYDVPQEVLDLVAQGFLVDASWHNDVAPSFTVRSDANQRLRLWVDHPETGMRENLWGSRFAVVRDHDGTGRFGDIHPTDDINEAIAKLKAWAIYEAALEAASVMMEAMDIEPTSALKQAASDRGIAWGDDMGAFVDWAHERLGISA